jgi:hypothetical protein
MVEQGEVWVCEVCRGDIRTLNLGEPVVRAVQEADASTVGEPAGQEPAGRLGAFHLRCWAERIGNWRELYRLPKP